jgi:phasin family protein
MSKSAEVQLETKQPEELLDTTEQRARFNDSMDIAEAAALVRSMRRNARRPDGTLGITQEELANRIGVSQTRISHIENGVGRDGPSFTLLKRISRACDVEWAVNEVKPGSRRTPPSAAARPSFFDFDVTKMMADFRFRPLELETWMASQRRNIEALAQANQLTAEAVQAVTRRQIEIARQTLEDMSALFRDLTQPGSTEDRIAKNTEYAKKMLDQSASITEAADVLRKRASEGLDELRDLAKQQSAH